MALLLRNLLWASLCPGTVTLLLPWYILSDVKLEGIDGHWQQWAGLGIGIAGLVILIWCIAAFARHGKGTLSPLDPTKHLVVQGLYKYMRNPMYLGVLVILLGESLFFQSTTLLGYTAVVFIVFNLFICLYEEPHLRRQFGEEYVRYCAAVGRWIPGRRYLG